MSVPELRVKEYWMNRLLILTCLFTACTAAVVGQTSLLADGNPPLTQAVVDRVESVFERLLDIRLTATQHARLRQGLIVYWTEKDQNGMRTTLTNARYYDSPAEIAELRSSGQTAIIEGLRRDAAETNDPVSTVLVEAFDQAHPNMRASTRARTFADLVGTWKAGCPVGGSQSLQWFASRSLVYGQPVGSNRR